MNPKKWMRHFPDLGLQGRFMLYFGIIVISLMASVIFVVGKRQSTEPDLRAVSGSRFETTTRRSATGFAFLIASGGEAARRRRPIEDPAGGPGGGSRRGPSEPPLIEGVNAPPTRHDRRRLAAEAQRSGLR